MSAYLNLADRAIQCRDDDARLVLDLLMSMQEKADVISIGALRYAFHDDDHMLLLIVACLTDYFASSRFASREKIDEALAAIRAR